MLNVHRVAGALGGEVRGADLSSPLSQELVRELRGLLNQYEVLFFRDQAISAENQRALGLAFGPLQSHPAYSTVDGVPEVTILNSTSEMPTKIEMWHSDMTFLTHPPMATVLQCVTAPPQGGDTLWASATAAYEELSQPMQTLLDGLSAVHDFSYGFKESLAEEGGRERLASAVAANPPITHPVIRVHPETGKKVVFVNSLFTTHIRELPAKESASILSFLYEHMATPEYTVRFSWEPGSIALWDNRSTQHRPINDYFPATRCMHRVTVDGDRPY